MIENCVCVFAFKDPPTAKVIWIQGHSHPTDWRCLGWKLQPSGYKARVDILQHSSFLLKIGIGILNVLELE